ncbi:mtor-associated protein meak7 [Anaeramoeba flamelloides]|uniref:Oxidation resistance protein 1 n=1 Tax=Anaeramoeba flamelloides TaxID=1746091 RepID=A0ABQ8XVB6_9EUKA|nr:mtor-associated protein meak7 [Anaeramoeba flamelloides]
MTESTDQLLHQITLLVEEGLKSIQENMENYMNTNLNQIIRKLNDLDSQVQKLDKRVMKLEKNKQPQNGMNSRNLKNQGLQQIQPLNNIMRNKSFQNQKKDQNSLQQGYENEEKEISQFWSEIDPESQNIVHELGSQSAPENMVLEEMNSFNTNNNKNMDNYLFNKKNQKKEEEEEEEEEEQKEKTDRRKMNLKSNKQSQKTKYLKKIHKNSNNLEDPNLADVEESDGFQTEKTIKNKGNVLNLDDNNNSHVSRSENGNKKTKKIITRKKKRYNETQYSTPKTKTPYSSKSKKHFQLQQTPVQRAKRMFTEKSQKTPFLSPKTPSFETIRKLPFAISMIGEAEKRERELLKFNPNFNYKPFEESDILDEALAMVLYLAIPFKVLPQTVLLYSDLKNERSLQEFHRLVDNKGATIIIMRNEEGFIFGGFASSKWNTDQVYFGNSKCFLFNLSLDTKIPYLKKNQKKCLWGSQSAIKFGTTDLVLQQDFQNCYSHIESCYGVGLSRNSIEAKTLLTGEDHFIPEIIEVFGFAKLEN